MKTMVIMRGLPGSGKSTLAVAVATLGQGVPFSTDDFFVGGDGVYRFDPAKLVEAHAWNQGRVREALRGDGPVVVDNTNIRLWEMAPYVAMADEAGWAVEVATPLTEWARDAAECARRNSHGVPLATIERMLAAWEDFSCLDEIRASAKPKS